MVGQRDKGLVRALGSWGLAANIVNIVVGAGIFALPSALAAALGTYAPLAILACAVAVGAVAICFAEGGSRVPTSGGVYGCIEAALGPLAGFVAGTVLWVSDVLACGGVAAALADVAASLTAPALVPAVRTLVIIAVIGGIALLNIGGVARGARLVGVATFVKLVPLAVFLIVGLGAVSAAHFAPPPAARALDPGRALLLALFAFTGMEASLCASGEVAEPARTIPRALALAIGGVTVLYLTIQIIAQGILGPALASSAVPLADAMAQVSGPLRALMLAGAALSMFGWIGSDILSTPRMVFAFARDGYLPRSLGRVHPRTHAPHVAIACYALIAALLALTGTFAELAVLSTLGAAALYIAGCAAAWRLARRGVALAGAPLNCRSLPAAAIVGIASMLVPMALASRAEILGLLALLAAAAVVFLLHRRAGFARAGA
ncbi:MAG TPA: amino acid permease [Steroidobacteraceae bacterium]|nr:amino acid permease [Steroidobacteraceae bacterium]